ncbi:helix-turn-helix domain-containing protein [Streptomyces fradiae]|uniref:helix-turn-helix domain-containing protein n=1 Tax=Streptomyces fradiae TaxID=1906 RepID=UPI002943F466|nr:helix-turn-helix transcriptional regulator [Streptomyces fradiae]WOI58592.1 helix-turn-helix transcriptional regulator [Streptomyces fradiae]
MSGHAPWTDPRLRAAWARADWGAILREYRRATGLTQRALEPLVGMPQPHISAIESGRRHVRTADVRQRITCGLQVPAELRAAGQHPAYATWDPDPELHERVARAHQAGRIDLATADRIGAVLARHRRDEDDDLGVVLWPVVRAQLDTVTRLLPGASGPVADRLLLLAAEHAHWLSWVAWQARQSAASLAWLDAAHGWAVDGGHTDMASWTYRVRAWYTLRRADPVRALRIAEAARTQPGLSPAAGAVAAHTAAMAAASVGERDRARRYADEALDLALRAPDEEARPGWLYWLTPARARLQAADTLYACRDWAGAAAGLREALAGLEGCPRDRAHYEARLADSLRRV